MSPIDAVTIGIVSGCIGSIIGMVIANATYQPSNRHGYQPKPTPDGQSWKRTPPTGGTSVMPPNPNVRVK